MGEIKRISFDRSVEYTLTSAVYERFRDKERVEEGWERVYTSCSIVDLDNNCDKFRFGTGGEDLAKWHNEQVNPVGDVVYCNCWEYHCRRHDRAIWGVYGGTVDDRIVIVWHGYDKLIRER